MDSIKEQLLRRNRISNKENNLKSLYINVLLNSNEGTAKKEIYELLKDELSIINNTNTINRRIG